MVSYSLAKTDRGIRVDPALFVDPANLFEGAHIERALSHAVSGARGGRCRMCHALPSPAWLPQGGRPEPRFSTVLSCAIFACKTFRRFFVFSRSLRYQTRRTPNAEIDRSRRLGSLAMWACPQFGC